MKSLTWGFNKLDQINFDTRLFPRVLPVRRGTVLKRGDRAGGETGETLSISGLSKANGELVEITRTTVVTFLSTLTR